MPDTPYTFHIPYPDEGQYGTLKVVTGAETVEVHTYGRDRTLLQSDTLELLEWEEAIRGKGMVLTPLIQRYGTAVRTSTGEDATIGCLIPPEHSPHFLDCEGCFYRALISEDLDVAELFFMDVLTDLLIPVGEILYLNMQVLEDERFRAQGAGGKVLYTRLNVPHIRSPEVGKLYVTCLHQPRSAKGRSTRSATAITLAVNPWDVQLASAYAGPPGNVVKHLQ
jgi:hypothetical protein